MTINPTMRPRRAAVAVAASAILAGAVLPVVPAGATPRPAAAHPAAAVAATARSAAAAHPAAAAPVGTLTPQGCTIAAGTATCDLYAMAATTSMVGQAIPIWGFSSSGAAGTATAPGPVLVVPQGVTVHVQLHNQLSQAMSLAFPGQPATAFTHQGGDDVTGVAAGGTGAYEFTADRPGTFLYEAGHTENGARQVAMGLAGALVVLPADGSAYGNSADMPDTSYADDAVLVLSEIDPAFNADPMTFDMRQFAPKYRLINGKPFPESASVPTDQGHKVLLRYINVGSQAHAMSVLGVSQVEVAQDAHPMKYTTTVTAETVDAGQSLDTIVTMPSGPESKVAVYEAAQHLDNNGQDNGNVQQVAFGGMMAFLDTNAPPPTTDLVGPVSKHVTAGPNPSDGLGPVTITADLSDATTGGSNVSAAEFVVDDAVTTAAGFGEPMTGAFGTVNVTGATGTIPVGASPCDTTAAVVPVTLSCLSAGKHKVLVRAEDSGGQWGVVGSVILNLPKTGPQTTNGSLADSPTNVTGDLGISATGDDSDAGGTITAAEFFLDTVGANGSGTPLTTNRTATVVSEDGVLSAAAMSGLLEGGHHIFVHSKDSLNLWGPTLDLPFVVDTAGPTVSAASIGPNPSNGLVGDASNPDSLLISAEIVDPTVFGGVGSKIVDAEAFLDPTTATPAGGSGLELIADDGRFDSHDEHVYGLVPLSQVRALTDGEHQLYVRGEDAAGNWGPMLGFYLNVDRTAPAVTALAISSATPPIGGRAVQIAVPAKDASLIIRAEYWFGSTDPGQGRGHAIPVNVVKGKVVGSVSLVGVGAGAQRLNVRVQDLARNWSRVVVAQLRVIRPNSIFRSNFEPVDPKWSASTGRTTTSHPAAVGRRVEPRTTRGLRVTMSGGRANRAGFVTDSRPIADRSYHVRFAFDRHTLHPTNDDRAAVTVFEARSATTRVFALQERVVRGRTQLRTVLDLANGAVATGRWIKVSAGPHTVWLDWGAAKAGSVRLRVNGLRAQQTAGDTSGLVVETARLGVISGWDSHTKGVAYFDSFASARKAL